MQVGALIDNETRRFATPLQRYRFPLAPGETWNQWVDNFNETTQQGRRDQPLRARRRLGEGHHAGRHVRRDPHARADASRRRGVLALSDDVQLRDLVRAAVGAPVREEKEAQYCEKRRRDATGRAAIRAQHTLLELVRTRRAKRGSSAFQPTRWRRASSGASRRRRSPVRARCQIVVVSAPGSACRSAGPARRARAASRTAGDHVEAERADRRGVVAVAFERAPDPARDLRAAGVGEARELREARDRHDPRHDRHVDAARGAGVDEAPVRVGVEEVLRDRRVRARRRSCAGSSRDRPRRCAPAGGTPG